MNWVLRRVGQSLFVLWAVLTISFALIELMPGGPADFLRAQLMSQEDSMGDMDMEHINRQVELYTNIHPDLPIWEKYMDYMIATVQGDFGRSIYYARPNSEIILQALPWTVFVVGIALVLTFVINIVIGAIMAYKEGSRFDVGMTFFSILSTSIPYYIAAIGLLVLFAFGLPYEILPIGGRYNPNYEPWTLDWIGSVIAHATLPIISFVFIGVGSGALIMRGNCIQVLGSDYLRVGRLRGLSDTTLSMEYVGRNAVLPMYTSFMIAIGNVFGGAVILEEIFVYPGIGYYMFQAVSARDYTLLMGTFVVITVAVVVCLFIADLTYGWIDPRVSEKGGGESEAF